MAHLFILFLCICVFLLFNIYDIYDSRQYVIAPKYRNYQKTVHTHLVLCVCGVSSILFWQLVISQIQICFTLTWHTLRIQRSISFPNFASHKRWLWNHWTECELLTKWYCTTQLFTNMEFVFIIIVQFMMNANSQIRFELKIVFVYLYITPSHYHHCASLSEDIELLKCRSDIVCRVCE